MKWRLLRLWAVLKPTCLKRHPILPPTGRGSLGRGGVSHFTHLTYYCCITKWKRHITCKNNNNKYDFNPPKTTAKCILPHGMMLHLNYRERLMPEDASVKSNHLKCLTYLVSVSDTIFKKSLFFAREST